MYFWQSHAHTCTGISALWGNLGRVQPGLDNAPLSTSGYKHSSVSRLTRCPRPNPALLTCCQWPRVANVCRSRVQTEVKKHSQPNVCGCVLMLETLGFRPSLEILCSDKKTDCEREKEKEVFAFLLSCCCLKMENYCIRCPKSGPNFALKHIPTHIDTHTHKPPVTAPRPLHRKWFDWVRSTWWRYCLVPL